VGPILENDAPKDDTDGLIRGKEKDGIEGGIRPNRNCGGVPPRMVDEGG